MNRPQVEPELVRRAQSGDEPAFAEIVSARLGWAWRLVRAIGGDELDTDDVVQEAFLMVWRDVPRLRDPAAFDGWLRSVVVHAARNALRRRGPIRLVYMGADPSASRGDDEAGTRSKGTESAARDDVGLMLAEREALERAFGRLTPDERSILVLRYIEDLPLPAIAETVGRPVGTVKSRLAAAREALRAALSAEER